MKLLIRLTNWADSKYTNQTVMESRNTWAIVNHRGDIVYTSLLYTPTNKNRNWNSSITRNSAAPVSNTFRSIEAKINCLLFLVIR